MTRCASCPGTDILRQFLSDLADEENEQITYSTYPKFGNAQENLMEKGVFLGAPKNPIFVGKRRIFFWP